MDPDRWKRLEELYHTALEREPEQRSAFLAEVCRSDDELRGLLDDLLSHNALTNGLVAQPIWEAVASSTKLANHISVGTRLGPYEIRAALGEGGMGKVYRALDTRLDRPIAIKFSGAQFSTRFEREARAISALNHPNICTLYDVGPNYLVMELVEGETLAQRIERSGPLPIQDALEVALQIAQALETAHAKNIVHRDLKPANVNITPEGRVKVLDFGLAKSIRGEPIEGRVPHQSPGAPDATVAGQIVGTPAYMSPEQARGENVDSRTDIWAFGCLLYELLAGTRPFAGQDNRETITAILTLTPNWRVLPAKTPKRIAHLVRTCLEKDPQQRPPNIAVIRARIEDASRWRQSNRWRIRVFAAAGAAALISAGLLFWVFRTQPFFTTAESIRPIPLTSYPGNQSEPTFSPDGNQVAFAWDGEKQDNFDIYVKPIGTGPPARLTHDPAAEQSPAWSPDGKWIAFLRASAPGTSTVVLIPAAGGPERIVAEVAAVSVLTRTNLAWSPDGKWLAVPDHPQGQTGGIFLLSVETGARRRLTTLPEGGLTPREGGLAFSPDGSALAFIREVAANTGDVYSQALRSDLTPAAEPRRLTRDNQDKVGVAWAPDGRSLIFSSGAPGNEELWRMPPSENALPARLTRLTSQNEVLGIAVSPRSHRLVFTQSRRELDIYRVDLERPGGAVRSSAPLIVSSRYDRHPTYSPDGKKIAFVSLRSGNWQLWVTDGDGTNPVQLTFFERGEVGAPEWSPDGRQIGFMAHVDSPAQPYIVNANGGEPRKLDALGEVVRHWTWSHDGRWIFFSSARSGSPQIWRIPASGGQPEQLTRQGSEETWFMQSSDDKLLYYVRPSGLWSVSSEGGEEQQVFKLDQSLRIINTAFEATPAGIYFVGGGTTREPGSLMFYRFSDRSIKKVTGVESPSSYGLSLSPDGRHLLYTKFTGIGSDLMLVENFR